MYFLLIGLYVVILLLSYIIYKDNCRYLNKRSFQIIIGLVRCFALVILFLRFFYYHFWSDTIAGNLLLYVASFYLFHFVLSFLFFLSRKIFKKQKRIHGIESMLILLMISLVLCMFSFDKAVRIVDKDYYIYNEKSVTAEILLVSDLHLGNSLSGKRIDELVDRFTESDVDLILIAGDLYDEATGKKDFERFLNNMKRVDCPIYYIRGNHESYSKYDKFFSAMMKQSGMICLNDGDQKYNHIVLTSTETQQTSSYSNHDFLINVTHYPVYENRNDIDLQVSGHTHNGQIIPENLIFKLLYSNLYGYYDENYPLVVTSGCGTNIVPMRLGSDSEIVHLHILQKSK